MSKLIKNVVHVRIATINGEEQKIYTNHGCVLETKNGGLCIILNSQPFPEDGKIIMQLYDPKPKQDGLVEPKKKASLALDTE